MGARVMLDIVIADTENRCDRHRGRYAGRRSAVVARGIGAMPPSSEVRHFVPDGGGLEKGNFAEVGGGMHRALLQHIGSTPRRNRSPLLRTGQHVVACAVLTSRRWLAPRRHSSVGDNEREVGCRRTIDCLDRGRRQDKRSTHGDQSL